MSQTGPEDKKPKEDLFTTTGELAHGYEPAQARANALAHAKKKYGEYVGRGRNRRLLLWNVDKAGWDEGADCFCVIISAAPEGANVQQQGLWEYHADYQGNLLPGTPIQRQSLKYTMPGVQRGFPWLPALGGIATLAIVGTAGAVLLMGRAASPPPAPSLTPLAIVLPPATASPTPTPVPKPVPTPTRVLPPTPFRTATLYPTYSPPPTYTPLPTYTPQPTYTPVPTPTRAPTPSATAGPTLTPTISATPPATPKASPSPSASTPVANGIAASLAQAVIALGYNVRYVERSDGQFKGSSSVWNYVVVGIQTEEIPESGNYNISIARPVLDKLIPLMQNHYPTAEVWIVVMFRDTGGRIAMCSRSVPKFNIGGCNGFESAPAYYYDGQSPNWHSS